jgi:hypothetical protein
MSTSTLTPRQTFRETVARVAAAAKAKLPECNGRVESAVRLVLGGDVFVSDDGTVEVGSCTDPLTMHRLSGASCSCEDFQHGRAPGSWCKHRLAHAISTRVHQEMAARSTPVETAVELPVDFEPYPDNDPGPVEEQPPAPAPAPLPEAPVSITLKATLHGHEVLVTLRGTDFASVKAQVEAASAWLQAQAPQVPAVQGQGAGWCARHQVQMQQHTNAKGSWFSHFVDGRHCKGR